METLVANSCPFCGSTYYQVFCSFPELTRVRCTCGLICKVEDAMAPEVCQRDHFFNKPGARRPCDTRQRPRVSKSRK